MSILGRVYNRLFYRGIIRDKIIRQDEINKELITRFERDEESIRAAMGLNTRIEDNEKIVYDLITKIQGLEDKFEQIGVIVNDDGFIKKSTSQAGEDGIISYILTELRIPLNQCTYLDLGANHAKHLSNTYPFYEQGAHGVLVEANPDLIPELKFYRNSDIIINKCVDTVSGRKVQFSILNGDGLSTPCIDSTDRLIEENPNLKVEKIVEVETISVNDIFEKYFAEAPILMSIDVEGKDLEIMKSIDFDSYRPLIILTEMIEYSVKLQIGSKNKEILDFMLSKGYEEFAFTGINSIFIDKSKIN